MRGGAMNPLSLDIDTMSRDILVSVLDAMPVCVFLIENESIFCNLASERVTGYDRQEITTVDDFFAKLFGNASRQARSLFEADQRAGFPVPRECSIIGRDGRNKVVELTGSGSSRSKRLLCTLQDVSNCYRPDGEPGCDSELTLQMLTRNALRESEERYRFLSELTSDYVYYCTRSGSDPFQVRWMGGAVQQITGYSESEIFDRGCWLGLVHLEDRDRVAALLLELRPGLRRIPVNLSVLSARIALTLKETEPDRVVEFVITPDLYASCYPILVRQLFENLIGNAWKYTGKLSEARIEFGMDAGNEGAVFFVKDNGAGFDMAFKDNLFHPFQRLHGAEFEGNGVGLATAQRIVQRHGGSIWAEGALEQGARFYFTLP